MSILRVEQLEPRQLLSGGCFAPQSNFRPPGDADSAFPRIAERRSFVDFAADHYSFGAPTWSHAVVVDHAGPPLAIIRLPIGNDGSPRSGPAPVGGGPAGRDESGGGEPGPATVVAARVPAGTEVPRETAVAAPPGRQSIPPSTVLDLAGAAALRLTVPVLVAVAPPVAPLSLRDEIPLGPNPVTSGAWARESTGGSVDAARPPITPPELPPALSSMLSILPPMDLADLGRGLRRFVGQLETAGQSLLRPVERGGFWPWIVAAAAALAACEITRREFRTADVRGPSLDSSDF